MSGLSSRDLPQSLLELEGSDPDAVNKLKLDLCRRLKLKTMPRNSDILNVLPETERSKFTRLLRLKKVRSISGVNVIGVMTAPRGCPHGRCVFCPMERGFPMSYIGGEPAAMRGYQLGYDPNKQIHNRLDQLREMGHEPSKVELVIQGGTFLAAPEEYQEWFIQRSLDAINGAPSSTLNEAKRLAETSRIRNVGLTIETKPDWCKQPHIDRMLNLGATRVEIGVQIIDDYVYKLTNRGHTVRDVVEAFRLAKDAGFKIVAHMMPGLPGSSIAKDLESFRALFGELDFKPDMLKIYPCLVVEGTELYQWWRKHEYEPYSLEETVELITEVKRMVPPWIRIMRVQREFPASKIAAGVKKGNIRELALQRLKMEGLRCRCIRCREVGHRTLKEKIPVNQSRIRTVIREYEASQGVEFFISMEDPDQDVLIGYIRLRIPSGECRRPEISRETGIIRELHVYGPEVPVGIKETGAWQHNGYGAMLLKAAEEKARDLNATRMVIISALGTKAYYKRFGYDYLGPYMGKLLS